MQDWLTPQRGRVQVRNVADELRVGQLLEVMCLGQDARGHVRLSRKAVLPQNSTLPDTAAPAWAPPRDQSPGTSAVRGGPAPQASHYIEPPAESPSDDDAQCATAERGPVPPVRPVRVAKPARRQRPPWRTSEPEK